MTYEITNMTINDYDKSIDLWQRTDGLVLSEADSRKSIEFYLNHNPGMSYVCKIEEDIIGTILCGHDGRRGFIYHVAVDKGYRGQSIGKRLVENSLRKLKQEGIVKCHIFVIGNNEIGNQFWTKTGWTRRDDILLYSSSTIE